MISGADVSRAALAVLAELQLGLVKNNLIVCLVISSKQICTNELAFCNGY